jgi:hypothetical protein
MASLEYLTQNSLIAYPFNRSQPSAGAQTANPIQDNWFYDILFVSFSPSIRSVYVSFIEKTVNGDLRIQFNNSETFSAIGGVIIIPSNKVENHLQNKLNSFFSHQNNLFAVKFILGEGLVTATNFSQNYDPKEAELASGAIVLSSPKLLTLAAKAYYSQVLPGGEVETTVNLIKNFSEETYNPLITLRSNIEVLIDSPHTIGTYTPDPSNLELTVGAGKGIGLYDACPPEDQIEDVYTINKVSPNFRGSFYIKPSACHSLNTLSENDRVYYTSANLLDNYSSEIIIANHSLLLENHCQSKCPRENINAFAHYLNRVGDGLKELNEIVFNSIETRGIGTPDVDVFNASQFCNEGTEENPDPFLRCFEHTEPIDTFIDCNSKFRKYYHEFRTLQIFYDDLTIRNYTILEVIDDNSVRLDTPPTAGNSLWFRVKDNGVISNLNCATLSHNIQAEQNKNPYFKIKYTTREAYDSNNNYVTLVGVTLAIFNPSKTPVAISASFNPVVLVRKGDFKIRKTDSVEDNDTAEVTLNCREYAFIDAVFSIPCGVTGGSINTEVFQIIGEELVTIGEVHTISNLAGSLCPGEDFSGASTFRITKSGWQTFSGKFSTGIYSVSTSVILGDIPLSNWVVYQLLSAENKIEVKAAIQPTETLSKKYSILFKSTTTTNTVIYNRVILDYVAPPIIVSPLSSSYDELSPLMLGKNETYTEESPAFKISASNMQYSGDVATDEDTFYYEVTGLPEGLSLNSANGNVIGTVAQDVQTGENIELNITAYNASGEAINPQTIYIKLAVQDPPQITFDPSTVGDVFNISNFDTFTTTSPVFKINTTNLPIYLYTIYPVQGTEGLPAGLYFDQSLGVITGKITSTLPGMGVFEISATNLYGESEERLRFTLNYEIYAKPSITYPTTATTISTNISVETDIDSPLFTVTALQAFGGADNYAEGLTDTTRNKYTAPAWNGVTGIPPGFYLDLYSGKFYGNIADSEIPTDPLITSYVLTYPIIVSVSNPVGVSTVSITLQVASDTVPVINYVNAVRLIRNNLYTQQSPLFRITATNNPTSFSADGLPTGLSCTSDGYIIGTVDSSIIAGSYLVAMRALNENGSAVPLNCEVKVPVSIASITPEGPYNLTVNNNYENIFTVATSGVKVGDTVALTNSSPPPGLFFASNKLYGTPTARGSYIFRVTATTQNYGYDLRDITVAITAPSYTISGTVVDDLNAPVSGVTITVTTGLTAVTDNDGKYSIPLIPAGIYNVRAVKTGTLSTPTIQSITLPAPFGTPQPDLDKVNFVCIGPFRTIIGKLLRLGTLAPLAGLRVSDGFRTDTTDSFGTFELQISYNATPLTVTSSTYVFPPTTIPAGSDSIDNIVIYGQIGYTVSGQIVTPLNFESSLFVSITNVSDNTVYTVEAVTEGATATYSIKIPTNTTYSIIVTDSLNRYTISTAPNFTLTASKIINFTAIRSFNVSGVLKASSALSGDADILIADALVSIGNKTATTNSVGYFTIPKISNGDYNILASKQNLSFSPKAITVFNEDQSVEIFPSYFTVSGAVYYTDPNLKIAGPVIKVRKKEDNTLVRTVTATGEGYTVTALIPGEYVISAEYPGCVLSLNNSVDGSIVITTSSLVNKNFAFVSFPETSPNVPVISNITKLVNAFSLTVYTEPSATTSPVIKYDYSIDGGSTWVAVTSYTSPLIFDIPNIAINTEYTLKVKAYNLYSSTASIGYTVMSATSPDAPVISNVTTKPGGGGFLIYFEPPSANELPITRYDWKRNEFEFYFDTDFGWSEWTQVETIGDVTSPVATGLYYGDVIFTAGRTYALKIRARNSAGIGPESAYFSATLGTFPSSPENFSVDYIAQNNLNVVFNVGYDGGENITDIEYFIRQGAFATAEDNASYVSTGKTPDAMAFETLNFQSLSDATYTIQVRTVTVVGKSPWSLFTFSKAWYPLVAPTISSISQRYKGCDVYLNTSNLASSVNNGGAVIDRYRFFIGEELTVAAFELPAGSPFYRLTGLVNGEETTIRAAAVNKGNFQGPLSSPLSTTPAIGAPADPPVFTFNELTEDTLGIIFNDINKLEAGGDTAFLNIEVEINYTVKAPCEENPEELCSSQQLIILPLGALEAYTLENQELDKYAGVQKTIYKTLPTPTSANSYQFEALAPGQPLILRFRAINSYGVGPWSTEVNYTLGLPGRITEGTVNIVTGGNNIHVYISYDPSYDIVDENTSLDWALQRISIDGNTTTSSASISGIAYKFKRTSSSVYYSGEANLQIHYTIIDNPDWLGIITETANWPGDLTYTIGWLGELTNNPLWLGEPIYDYDGNFSYYDLNAIRTIDNQGVYYNQYAVRTISNGGVFYNTYAERNLGNGGLYYDINAERTLENGGAIKDYSSNKIVFTIDMSPFEITEPYDVDLRIYAKSENGTSEKYIAKKAERLPPASAPVVYDFYVGYNLIAFNATTLFPGNGSNLFYQYRLNPSEEWLTPLSGLSLDRQYVSYSIPQGSYTQFAVRNLSSAGPGPSRTLDAFSVGGPAAPSVSLTSTQLNELKCTISPPTDNGGATVTGYMVRIVAFYNGQEYTYAYRKDTPNGQYLNSTLDFEYFLGSSVTITRYPIISGVDFKIQVYGLNSRGNGLKTLDTFTPVSYPGPITDFSYEPGDRQILLKWKSGNTGGLSGGFKLDNVIIPGNNYIYTERGQEFSIQIPFAANTLLKVYSIRQYHSIAPALSAQTLFIDNATTYSLAAPIIGPLTFSENTISFSFNYPSGFDAWAEQGTGALDRIVYNIDTQNSYIDPAKDVTYSVGYPITTYLGAPLQLGNIYYVRFRAYFNNLLYSEYTPVQSVNAPLPPATPSITEIKKYVEFIEIAYSLPGGEESYTITIKNKLTPSQSTSFTFQTANPGPSPFVACVSNVPWLVFGGTVPQQLLINIESSNVSGTAASEFTTFILGTADMLTDLYPPIPTLIANGISSIIIKLESPNCGGPREGSFVFSYMVDSGGTMSTLRGLRPTYENGAWYATFSVTQNRTYTYYFKRELPGGRASGFSILTLTTLGLPSAPTNLQVTPADKSIIVSFTESITYGIPVESYRYRLNDTGDWLVLTGTSKVGNTITGVITKNSLNPYSDLQNSITYTVKVASWAQGIPKPSTAKSVTVCAVPSKILTSTITTTLTDRKISVGISPLPNNGGGTITKYSYSLDGGQTYQLSTYATLPLVITTWQGSTLSNAVEYPFKIRAVNAAGVGETSDTITLKIIVPPSKPLNLNAIARNRQITVQFNPPTNNGGAEITNYEYSTNDGITFKALSPANGLPTVGGVAGLAINITTLSTGTGTSLLVNGTPYVIKLRAVNSSGAGEMSTYLVAIPEADDDTPPFPPGFP